MRCTTHIELIFDPSEVAIAQIQSWQIQSWPQDYAWVHDQEAVEAAVVADMAPFYLARVKRGWGTSGARL